MDSSPACLMSGFVSDCRDFLANFVEFLTSGKI